MSTVDGLFITDYGVFTKKQSNLAQTLPVV